MTIRRAKVIQYRLIRIPQSPPLIRNWKTLISERVRRNNLEMRASQRQAIHPYKHQRKRDETQNL